MHPTPAARRLFARAATATLLAAVAATSASALAAPGAAAQTGEPIVLSRGHVDAVDVHLHGDHLDLVVHDGTVSPARDLDPADVVLQALPGAAIAVPDDPRYAFLGAAGSTVWVLPQVQDPELLWPGYGTTHLPRGALVGDAIELTMASVTGPGELTTFTVDPFGSPQIVWNTRDGAADTISVPVGTHAHLNWAFSALGEYTVTFRADGSLTAGGDVTSGLVEYTFLVGDPVAQPELTLGVDGLRPSYAEGDTVSLRAVPDPATDLDHYHWFSRATPDADWVVVPGAYADTLEFTATPQLDGHQYIAVLYDDDDHNEAAASEPVTIEVAQTPAPDLSQTILATIDAAQGALVVSIDPDDRTVTLPTLRLAPAGDHWRTAGDLRPVTVTDTRAARPGWNVAGQASDFTADGDLAFDAKHLGWGPDVLAQAGGQQVRPGPAVPSGLTSGEGLSVSRLLGSAPAGAGAGTARLGAELSLLLPSQTTAGAYAATLTVTAI